MGDARDFDLHYGVNTPVDQSNLSQLEKTHLPSLEVPSVVHRGRPFAVRISVGQPRRHPNENTHFVQWIQLYADDTLTATAMLVPGKSQPEVSFTLSLPPSVRVLRAQATCNLHNTWEAEVPLRWDGF